jgi:di/tricarboxylate transporter
VELQPYILVYAVLGLTLAAFMWGRVRYDVVALAALMGSVLLGLVPAEAAFAGFGHPAVITVAAVLVLSRGFLQSGLVDWIAARTLKVGGNVSVQVLTLSGVVALMSGFMNNVGALALMLPVALRMARENGNPPSLLLLPLAFGSLLGGLMTLIGTPPNIIIATFREREVGEAYGMFAFLPVGGLVLLGGLAFLTLAGWRLAPRRKGQASAEELFDVAEYLSELEVGEKSKANGWTLRELWEACGERVPVIAVVRGEQRFAGHKFHRALQAGDLLLVEAETEELQLLEEKGGLKLGGEEAAEKLAGAKDLQVVEAVVQADSRMVNRSIAQLRLLDRYGLHLMAVARQGARLKQRLAKIRFRAGDVLLFQGDEDAVTENLADLGCLPLASRDLSIGKPRRLFLSLGIFAAAIAAMLAGWLPAAIALTCAALLNILTGVLPLREAYKGIDWPIIILLGAMIPIGRAMETSGGAQLIADGLFAVSSNWSAVAAIGLLFGITMGLSNIINNAAAAVLMAPIAVNLARDFSVSADPFLMAVAVAASCAFLTPIGHQSNTLVMGPGGYRFSDYWRVGLPLSLLVGAIAIPAILWIWPL